MSETSDFYAPPQAESNFDAAADQSAPGYRDGNDLLVPAGHTTPRICILSGQKVSTEEQPLTVKLGPRFINSSLPMRLIFNAGLLYLFIAIICLTVHFLISIALFISFVVTSLIQTISTHRLRVFYSEDTNRSLQTSSMLRFILLIGLFLCFSFIGPLLVPDLPLSIHMLAGLGLWMVINYQILKSSLPPRVVGIQDQYYRIRGVHPDFLKHYPESSEYLEQALPAKSNSSDTENREQRS